MSTPTGHLRHWLLDALHQLRHSVPWKLVGAQTQFSAVPLAKCVQSAIHLENKNRKYSELSTGFRSRTNRGNKILVKLKKTF